MIVQGFSNLIKTHHSLKQGDVFIGMIPWYPAHVALILDVMNQGVICLPSLLSQSLSRSKTSQCLVYQDKMVPHSVVVNRRSDLINIISDYNRDNITSVVTKDDRLECGHGIRKWDHIEPLYNQTAFNESSFPFVLQPYVDHAQNIRVIMAQEFVEAYVRDNPYNFRKNLSTGGISTPFALNASISDFCRLIMNKGSFPYAHIDLMIIPQGPIYLSEISLNGGTKGAQISQQRLRKIKDNILDNIAISI